MSLLQIGEGEAGVREACCPRSLQKVSAASGLCVRASLTAATVLEKGQPAGRWAAGQGPSPCSPALL